VTAVGSAASEGAHTLRLIEAALDERYPGARVPHPLADHPGAPAGIVVRHGDAHTLVGLDLRGDGSGEWSLFATSVLAVAGTDVDAALEWANAKNRHLGVGKYYAAYSRDAGVAAIAYDTWVQGAMFVACYRAEPPEVAGGLASFLFAMVTNVIDTAAAEAQEAAAAMGGRPLGDSAADLQSLLVIALG